MRAALGVALVVAVAGFALWAGDGDEEATGETISVFGPWIGAEAEAFTSSMEAFEAQTGATVRYTGSLDFTADLRARVTGGVASPDIAMVPQPGLIAELADDGHLVELDEATVAAVVDNHEIAEADMTVEGTAHVVPYRSDMKSLVWYRPELFEQRGWEVPASLDGLHELVDEIEATTDIAPWCLGIFAAGQTGWPVTDWVEDVVLRRMGPDGYDEWVSGARGFDDPAVRAAFTEVRELVLAPGRVAGGLRSVLDVEVAAASAPLFSDPAGCALYKQASFARSWFPEGTSIGPGRDVHFFVLPGVDAGDAAPIVRGGDGAVQFDDRAVVDALMAHLASPEGAREWARRGGFLSAGSSLAPDTYYRGVDARLAATLLADRVVRFDASDLYPSQFRDRYLEAITDWVSGTVSVGEMLDSLEEARRGGS